MEKEVSDLRSLKDFSGDFKAPPESRMEYQGTKESANSKGFGKNWFPVTRESGKEINKSLWARFKHFFPLIRIYSQKKLDDSVQPTKQKLRN